MGPFTSFKTIINETQWFTEFLQNILPIDSVDIYNVTGKWLWKTANWFELMWFQFQVISGRTQNWLQIAAYLDETRTNQFTKWYAGFFVQRLHCPTVHLFKSVSFKILQLLCLKTASYPPTSITIDCLTLSCFFFNDLNGNLMKGIFCNINHHFTLH